MQKYVSSVTVKIIKINALHNLMFVTLPLADKYKTYYLFYFLSGRVYEQNYAISIDAAELDFSIDRNGLQIPSELSSGSVVELTQDISMPRGKIVDFEFLAGLFKL